MVASYCRYVFFAALFVMFALAFRNYPGHGLIYALFTMVSIALLCFGFRGNAFFFDAFIGVLFWLGFWFKLTFRVAFMDSRFHEAVGNFDGSGAAFDRALLATSCGFFGLLMASFLRGRYVFAYSEKLPEVAHEGLMQVYRNHRRAVLCGFATLLVSVATTNMYFGIYQRGAIPRTVMPYGLGGIYSWLLLFGLASMSALLLHFEFSINRKVSYLVAVLGLLEGFLTNVSLLSRGMIINAGALGYGVLRSLRFYSVEFSLRFWVVWLLVCLLLFGSSVVLVERLRLIDPGEWGGLELKSLELKLAGAGQRTQVLFLDRWVGMEGIMAVSSYPGQGWGLWIKAWEEPLSNQLSFFDANLITSPYRDVDMTKYHSVSLPGILAFCFYPGSYPFLFMCMFALGAFAAAIEMCVFKLGGRNMILCALLAQVVAYRYAHFGYVPGRSYLLFGALYLNLFIIYFSNEFALRWNARSAYS